MYEVLQSLIFSRPLPLFVSLSCLHSSVFLGLSISLSLSLSLSFPHSLYLNPIPVFLSWSVSVYVSLSISYPLSLPSIPLSFLVSLSFYLSISLSLSSPFSFFLPSSHFYLSFLFRSLSLSLSLSLRGRVSNDGLIPIDQNINVYCKDDTFTSDCTSVNDNKH